MSTVEVLLDMALSTIDFSRYTAGDAAERLKLAEEMVAGFKKDGAVTLINYDPTENMAAECIQAVIYHIWQIR
jgi:isopenicillin N synthase-like dioxygenase